MKKVAVLIDGGYFTKTFREATSKDPWVGDVVALAKRVVEQNEELFRIYYYDCPPYDGEVENPIDKTKRDYSPDWKINKEMFSTAGVDADKIFKFFIDKRWLVITSLTDGRLKASLDDMKEEIQAEFGVDSGEIIDVLKKSPQGNKKTHAIQKFQRELSRAEYVAFRAGTLKANGWSLKKKILDKVHDGKPVNGINADQIEPIFKQKGVDVRIGLDMAHLSSRKIVDKIAIVAGDSDFIPAMKYARREGILIKFIDITGHNGGKKKIDFEILAHIDFIQEINFKD